MLQFKLMAGLVLLFSVGRLATLLAMPEASQAFTVLGSFKALAHIFLGVTIGCALGCRDDDGCERPILPLLCLCGLVAVEGIATLATMFLGKT